MIPRVLAVSSPSHLMDEEKEIQQEIFTYTSNGLIYSSNWSIRPDKPYRIAFGSFVSSGTNYIDIIQLNKERTNFVRVGGIEHGYPATKLAWIPDKNGTSADLFATTSDYLRLYSMEGDRVKLKSCLMGVSKKFADILTPPRTKQASLLRHSPRLTGMR